MKPTVLPEGTYMATSLWEGLLGVPCEQRQDDQRFAISVRLLVIEDLVRTLKNAELNNLNARALAARYTHG